MMIRANMSVNPVEVAGDSVLLADHDRTVEWTLIAEELPILRPFRPPLPIGSQNVEVDRLGGDGTDLILFVRVRHGFNITLPSTNVNRF